MPLLFTLISLCLDEEQTTSMLAYSMLTMDTRHILSMAMMMDGIWDWMGWLMLMF